MTLLTEPSAAAVAPTAVRMSDPPAPPPCWTEATDQALFESVDGNPVEKNLSAYSPWIATEIARVLGNWARERRAGFVMSEAPILGVYGRQNHGRRPDVCFVSRSTLAELPTTGDLRVAPDLVVEVVSPNDSVEPFEAKLLEYRMAGVKRIWTVFPTLEFIRIHLPDGSAHVLKSTDRLEDESVLPGFFCPLADIFTGP